MGGFIVLYLYALATCCDSVLVSTRLRVTLLMRLASADACTAALWCYWVWCTSVLRSESHTSKSEKILSKLSNTKLLDETPDEFFGGETRVSGFWYWFESFTEIRFFLCHLHVNIDLNSMLYT